MTDDDQGSEAEADDDRGSGNALDDDMAAARERLVEKLKRRGYVSEDRVLEAIASVPRHEFVSEKYRDSAYVDRPLPIGKGQTISAPHMVGMMVELLEVTDGDRVLEIGTGCGYHAAVVAEVVGDENVYSVEVSEELAADTQTRLDDMSYTINVRVGDGREGWPDQAPYDAAYLTCAAPELPDPIVEQVRSGGTIVAPIGTAVQTLYAYQKREDGSLDSTSHGGVRFVQMQ